MTLSIGLDLDGVVYDFVRAHRNYLMNTRDDLSVADLPEPSSWNVWEHWQISRVEWQQSFAAGVAERAIFTGGHRYAYDGAIAAVRQLADAGHTIHVVTHRPPEAVALTAEWLAEVGLPFTSLTFAKDKSTVPVDVMIEDNVDNALAVVAAGSRAILMDRPWNRRWVLNGVEGEVDQLPQVKRCWVQVGHRPVRPTIYRASGWAVVAAMVAILDEMSCVPTECVETTSIGDPAPSYSCTVSWADITPQMKTQETALQEAQRLVHGDRGEDYGHPSDDFTRTGRMWGAILDLPDAVPPELVGLCMVAVKISREVNHPKRDNRVDGAGYFETVNMVHESGRKGL